MRIREVEFVRSARVPEDYPPEDRPEIAFAGRSNVGKSSLINALLGRRKIARVSSTPGMTRAINFYLVNRSFYLVDLPGYGYAKVPLRLRRRWRPLMEGYIEGRRSLRGMVVIMDTKVGATDLDLQLILWLRSKGIPFLPVLTKADKVSQRERAQVLRSVSERISFPSGDILPFSARTGEGKGVLWARIRELLEGKALPGTVE